LQLLGQELERMKVDVCQKNGGVDKDTSRHWINWRITNNPNHIDLTQRLVEFIGMQMICGIRVKRILRTVECRPDQYLNYI